MYINQFLHLPSIQFSWQYAKSQLRSKYRYTALGFLWNFLEPALYLVILSLVFSVVNRMNINDYAVFLFSALVPWRYFEKVVNTIMESIVSGEWLIKKMYVSPFAFPLNRLIISSFEFLFSMISAFILFIFLKENWRLFQKPVYMASWPTANEWIISFGFGITALLLGIYLVNKYKSKFYYYL